ncbi:MAG: dehydratase [Candidatus Rokuibacteriota bacterium]|nr:MAG: dehydratase [Candidatus Rokubacteria bacterium]
MDLPRVSGAARRSRADHPPPRRADRGAPAAADGGHSAEETPGLVRERLSGRRAPARGAVPSPGRRGGTRGLLERLVTAQRYFEDFTVGDRFKSPSRTLTDAHFMFFAGMTGDNHPIHYDEEYGKKTRYGGRLAHGLLLASLTAVGASTLAPSIEDSIVAFVEQTTRFRGPALIGDTISPEHEVVALERKRSAGLLTLRVALKNQRGEVVLEGEHRYLIAYRPAA